MGGGGSTCRLSVKISTFVGCREISVNFFVASREFFPRFLGGQKYFLAFCR